MAAPEVLVAAGAEFTIGDFTRLPGPLSARLGL
jgi:hypothetical protein